MEFGVLGPLVVANGSGSLLPTAPKTRQFLALLLLNAGVPVPVGTCIEELWGEAAPRTATAGLHTRVFQLRRALAGAGQGAGRQLVRTHHQGYSIEVPDGAFDLHRLEGRLAEFRRAQAARDDARISAALRSALALWRGPTLLDVAQGIHIQAYVTGLEDLRMTVLEHCIDAELRLGMHHQLISELSTLVSRHPVHENLHAQYMIALYRSGRIAQSLDIYDQLRRKLVEELGISPSHRIRRLQLAVLNESTELDVASSQRAGLSLDLLTSR